MEGPVTLEAGISHLLNKSRDGGDERIVEILNVEKAKDKLTPCPQAMLHNQDAALKQFETKAINAGLCSVDHATKPIFWACLMLDSVGHIEKTSCG